MAATGSAPVLFSEGEGPWEALPRWAACFIELGYCWPIVRAPRRLCFVSAPCESAAAGLIALGAMLRRLEQPGSDDLGTHLTRLRALTPENARGVILRHRVHKNRRYQVVREEASGEIRFQEMKPKDPERRPLIDAYASTWYFDGEPPVEGYRGAALPHGGLYASLLPSGQKLWPDNLSRTDSCIVLAGRSGGRSVTEQVLGSLRFRGAGQEAPLSELLAIHGWQPRNVSRVRFFNPRSGSGTPFDRPGSPPGLVVVDGPGTFEAAYDCPETGAASVLTVVPRTADPDQLDLLAARVETLTQWYEPDPDIVAELPALPAGVEIVTLRRGN